MEKVGYGNWAIWMAITVLLSLLANNVIAQRENKIAWVSDANFIDVGETAVTGSATLPSYLQRLRFFPKPLNKSCYRLPVSPNVPFLLRLSFALGNYSRFSGSYPQFTHTIETSGLLVYTQISDYFANPYIHEGIYVSSGEVLYVCLIRSRDTDDPFINAIELRTLQNGMYSQAKSGTMLFMQERADLGGNSIVRYPRDNFDRIWKPNIWKPDINLPDSSIVRNVSSKEPIFSDSTKNHPPTAVMQTAWVNIDDFPFTPPTASWAKSLLLLYLAELERLNTSESTSFYVTINGEYRSETIWLVRNYSALELTFISNETNEFIFQLVKAPRSTNRPIINAFEYYTIHHTHTATNSQDIEALGAIKRKYGIKGWISDPCFMIPWNGLGCVNSSLAIRISEINLSGRNLTGSVPEEIGQLTALVNVSLENNNLTGPLPDLSGLIMLERLHLQNNNLNGSLPDWLSNLNNLKELFIQNNNFSGVIPGQLFYKTSLNAIFTGNNYLCIFKAGECVGQIQETRSNSKRVNLGTILGITISGGLFALAMGGVIAVYRRKDDTIKVPQLEKYASFTVKDMKKATKNFSREIGQGNSGKVFHGKLQDGRDVAVKRFSTIPQFLNEADVLPKAQNKNLMPLHGYCNESKNPMLIYEHMSGGSLSDKLHGAVAGHSNLDWKTRLNIALNVAQGLEFMHAGCTPKIIHRDVKTANILLDNNMNAKLADFGISKIAMDGQASHATTAMAKGTPGYIAPEYLSANQVTEKIDVYSFGVVLFEMICGRKAADESLPAEESNLIKWVTRYVKDEKVDPKIIDPRLDGNNNSESINRVAKLALRCVDDTPSLRPSMTDVVGEIKDLDENDDTIKVPQLEKYPRFTFKDMVEATKDFSQEIGQENSGKVFYGKLLRDGREVAVKMFSTVPQFQKEADVLSKAQNKNLMPLHGYCNELKNPMLIYEYMSGGSLSDKLHGAVAGHSNLDWKTRLNIALNVAQGLEFMHAGCTPKIIHRDVKTANILLDNNMNAKLTDFGISRIAKDGEASHATTVMAKGTPEYIAPEYLSANQVTEKIDVYSFGVVLFEMICGRKAADESLPAEESNLIKWVTPYVKDEKAGPKIIDKRLAGNYNLESIDRVAKLALRCVDDTPSLRPSMTDVVGEIKDAITLEKENNAQFPDLKENARELNKTVEISLSLL